MQNPNFNRVTEWNLDFAFDEELLNWSDHFFVVRPMVSCMQPDQQR